MYAGCIYARREASKAIPEEDRTGRHEADLCCCLLHHEGIQTVACAVWLFCYCRAYLFLLHIVCCAVGRYTPRPTPNPGRRTCPIALSHTLFFERKRVLSMSESVYNVYIRREGECKNEDCLRFNRDSVWNAGSG